MLNRSTKDIKTILARYHISPQQSLGQNFLVNNILVDDFVQAAGIEDDDIVLEVGAGFGTVTIPLAKRAKHVFAVEVMPSLAQGLRREYPQYQQKLTVIQDDILKLTIAQLFQTAQFQATDYKVVGAIPYNITSPLIHKLLTQPPLPQSITLLIQKEVAEKAAAQPPNATYLSNFIEFMGTATIAKNNIPPSAFYPPPRIQSAILRIDLNPKYPGVDPEAFSQFLHKGFTFPRKMLKQIFDESHLIEKGINPTSRPQEVPLASWFALFQSESL